MATCHGCSITLKAPIARRQNDRASLLKEAEIEYRALGQAEADLTNAFIAGRVEPSNYAVEASALRERRTSIDERVGASIPDPESVSAKVRQTLSLAMSLMDVYDALDAFGRVSLILSVFKAVVLNHDGIGGYSLKPPLDALLMPTASFSSTALVNEALKKPRSASKYAP